MPKTLLLLAAAAMMASCSDIHVYVAPNFSFAEYGDIRPVTERHKVHITAVFINHIGDADQKLSMSVKNHAERALRATGVLAIVAVEKADIHIKLRLEHVQEAANVENLVGNAVKTWAMIFSLGLIVPKFSSGYVMTVVYSDPKHGQIVKEYKHAIYTGGGSKGAPFENGQPTSRDDAFVTVIEELMLNFVHDMQKDGKLSFIRSRQMLKFSQHTGKFSFNLRILALAS